MKTVKITIKGKEKDIVTKLTNTKGVTFEKNFVLIHGTGGSYYYKNSNVLELEVHDV